MRVLFLCSEYSHVSSPLGGIFFKDQALALRKTGVEVDVVFVEPRSLRTVSMSALRRQHFQVVRRLEDGVFTLRQLGWNPGLPHGIGGRIYAAMTRNLAGRYFKLRGKPDLMHAHCALWAGAAAPGLKRMYGIPYVITEHHSTVLFPQRAAAETAIREAYACADRALSVSRYLAEAMARRVPGMSIAVVPNIVDTDFFSPVAGESRGESSGPRIAAIGNLDANKSYDVLLHAFGRVHAKNRAAHLTVCGEGELRVALERLACDLGVGAAVTFTGMLPRAQVRDVLRESDMLVSSSRFETFGVTLIEAGAVGIPVVATASGGPDEIVRPATGRLVPVGDVGALSVAIEETWRASWDRSAIRREILRNYGRASVSGQLRSVYESVIRSHGK
jgi:glycosyltransferase involved in cell wall biosynthesis